MFLKKQRLKINFNVFRILSIFLIIVIVIVSILKMSKPKPKKQTICDNMEFNILRIEDEKYIVLIVVLKQNSIDLNSTRLINSYIEYEVKLSYKRSKPTTMYLDFSGVSSAGYSVIKEEASFGNRLQTDYKDALSRVGLLTSNTARLLIKAVFVLFKPSPTTKVFSDKKQCYNYCTFKEK